MTRVRTFFCVFTLAALCSAPSSARADDTPDASAPDVSPPPSVPAGVEPPSLRSDPGVAYPAEALAQHFREAVTVAVLVDIDKTGAVADARIANPKGTPFEAAALAAARSLVFTPATRDGHPVASRIQHRYTFPPPPGRLAGKIEDASGGAPIANADVHVTSNGGRDEHAHVDAKGTWTLGPLPFGAYHVDVSAPGFAPVVSDEEIEPGSETRVTLRLQASALATDGGAGPSAAAEEIEQIDVRGERPAREVTRTTLDTREIDRIPGTNGDALRAIMNLPGVARPPGLAGLLIVRGAAPNQTQIFVDGTPVPIVFHFGGLTSVLPTEALDRLDFYPGNFSSFYGRANAGIVDAGIRDPKKDGYHGLVQGDLIDTRLMAEGPIADGWRFLVAGRRSWVDVWLGPILQATGASVTAAPVYYDYQALVQKDFSKTESFRLMLFGSDDRFAVLLKQASASDPGVGGDLSLATTFWRIQGRYKNKLSKDTELRLTAAAGEDILVLSLGQNTLNVHNIPFSMRAEVATKVTNGVTANIGFDGLFSPYNVFARLPPPGAPGQPPPGPGLLLPPVVAQENGSQTLPGAYAELELVPLAGTRILPGVRFDYNASNASVDVAPRLAIRQDIVRGFPRTTFKGGAGLFFQPTQPQDTSPVFGVPGAKDPRALQYGAGIEQEFTRNIELSLEGFMRQTDYTFTTGIGSVGRNRAFGLETLLRWKPSERFFGWLAYTLSRSVIQDAPGFPERIFQFDQTHILTVLGSYRLGHGWEIGARFRLVSGNMNTPQTYGVTDTNNGVLLNASAFPPFAQRLPLFHQLDIRVDKIWNFRTWSLDAYLDAQNVYNQGNVEGVSYNYNATKSTTALGLPFLPSLGLRAEL